MKIAGIRLRNFRCFHEAELLDLPRVSLIAGLNGVGKSSVADAIALALSGTCRGAESGRSLGELRRTGSRNRWHVEVDVVTGDGEPTTIRRSEGDGPASNVQRQVGQLTGLGPDAIRACLYSGELMRLKPVDRQRLVLDLARPAPITLPDELRQRIADALGRPATETVDRDGLERLYQDAYARRRDANVELRGAGEAVSMPGPPSDLLGVVSMTLGELQSNRSALAAKLTTLEQEHDGNVRALESAERRAREVAEQVRAARAELEVPPPDGSDLETRMAAVVEERAAERKLYEAADLAVAQGTEDFANHRAAHDAAESQLERLRSLGDSCPHCYQAVSPETKAAMVESVARVVRDEAEQLATIDKALTAARAVRETSLQRGRDLRRRANAVEEEAAAYEAAVARRAEVERFLSEHDANPDQSSFDRAALAVSIEEARGRIEIGRTKLSSLDEYIGARRQAEQHAARRGSLERAHGTLDRIVADLAELRETASGGELDGFLESVAKHLIDLGLDGVDLRPLVEVDGDPIVRGHPARMLSRVQSIEFGIAFQLATASVTGLGLVLIDDCDAFDENQAERVEKLIDAVPHQVFMFRAWTGRDPFAVIPQLEGILCAIVESGPDGSRIVVPGRVAA